MPERPLQPVHVFCILIAALCLAVASVLPALAPAGLDHFTTGAFWALALSTLAGEMLPLEIPRRSGDGEVTISTMFSFALLLGTGLFPAVAAQSVASVIQD